MLNFLANPVIAGDTAKTGLFIGLAAVAVILIVVVVITSNKKNKNNDKK